MCVGPTPMLLGRRAFVLLVLLVLGACRHERGPERADVDPVGHPDITDDMIHDANELLAQGRWAVARRLAERALAREPNHVGARTVLAAVAWGEGDVGGSYRLLREALALDPSDFGARLMLARNMQAEGRYAESLDVLESLAKSKPDEPDPAMLQLRAHYATLDVADGLKVANRMFASPVFDEYGSAAVAHGWADFLLAFAGEPALVELAGEQASVEFELHAPTSGMRAFALIAGERRPVLLSFYHSESLIDPELAASLRLAPRGSTQLFGWEQRDVALVPDVEFDGLRISRVPVVIQDLAAYAPQDPAHDVDLVLGLQVLHRFGAIVADHPEHTLELEVAVPLGPPSNTVERPLLLLDTWMFRVPATPIALDGSRREFWAWFGYPDVGAVSIEQQPYLAAGHMLAEFGELDDPATGREMVFLDEVAFGQLRIAGVGGIVYLDRPGHLYTKLIRDQSGFAIGGTINGGVLEQLRVTWVPSRAAIWLERPNRYWLPEVF
jgi:hypothetical protein